jgi:hypothetical protein
VFVEACLEAAARFGMGGAQRDREQGKQRRERDHSSAAAQ